MSKKTAASEAPEESDLRALHDIVTTTDTEKADDEMFLLGEEWVHEIFDGQKWVFAPLDKKGVPTAMFDAREWARAFLAEKGLPAAQDRERRRAPSIPVRGVARELWYDDTAENHLLSVEERFPTNSPEAWAARITRAFLIGRNQGEAEVARLLSVVDSRAMRHDANTGRSVRDGGRKGGTNPKLKRTTTADLVRGWRAALAKRESPAAGPSADARWIADHCPTAKGLNKETIRRYLGRFRKLGQKGA